MEIVVKLIRWITVADIIRIIVSKFSYKIESDLIVLFVIDKSSKICLYYAILPFSLPTSLRVKSSRESLVDLKKVA